MGDNGGCRLIPTESRDRGRAYMVPPPTTNHIVSPFVGAAFWDKIAAFRTSNSGALNACPRVRMAMVVANLLSPFEQREAGKCQLVTVAHVTTLTSKKLDDVVMLLEKIKDHMRSIVGKLEIECAKELGRADARMVYHILDIGNKSADRRRFETLECIMIEFIQGVSKLAPSASMTMFPEALRKEARNVHPKNTTGDKKKQEPTQTADEDETIGLSQIETLAEAKSKSFQVTKKGYYPDAHVTLNKRKRDDNDATHPVYKIMKVAETGARCKNIADGQTITIKLDTLTTDYSLVGKVHSRVMVFTQQIPDTEDYYVELVKNAIKLELFALAKKHSDRVSAIDLWENPSQVKSVDKITAKQLFIVPLTKNVGHREHTHDGTSYDGGCSSLTFDERPSQLTCPAAD